MYMSQSVSLTQSTQNLNQAVLDEVLRLKGTPCDAYSKQLKSYWMAV